MTEYTFSLTEDERQAAVFELNVILRTSNRHFAGYPMPDPTSASALHKIFVALTGHEHADYMAAYGKKADQ